MSRSKARWSRDRIRSLLIIVVSCLQARGCGATCQTDGMDGSGQDTVAFVWTVAGTVLSALGFAFAVLIAIRQNGASEKLSQVVNATHDTTREVQQAIAELRDERIASDPVGEDSADASPGVSAPEDPDALLRAVNARGAKLTPNQVKWAKKERAGGGRGNLGWFVESTDPARTDRWFVHRGRTVSARRAIPRDYLEAWEAAGHGDPKDIRLDFQVTQGGNSAWYVETYDGRTWRISKGGAGKRAHTVTEVID